MGAAARQTPLFGAAARSPCNLKPGPAHCRQAAGAGAPAGSLLRGAAAALPRAALPAARRVLGNAPNSALSAMRPASASWEDTPYLLPKLLPPSQSRWRAMASGGRWLARVDDKLFRVSSPSKLEAEPTSTNLGHGPSFD